MLRKILSLLFILTLLPCAIAEETPAANPFIGAWEPLYYIQDGRPLTEEENTENPVMFTFTEECIEMLFQDESTESTAYARDGAVCTVEGLTFTLEHEDLIVGSNPYEGLSFLLVRIDPLALNNPFIGTWEVLCFADGSYVASLPSPDEYTAAIFAADSVQIVSGSDTEVYSCLYGDGMCTVYTTDDSADEAAALEDADGSVIAICTITADGLLCISNPGEEAQRIICAREAEEVPAEISQFFGTWKDVAAITNEGMYTDQAPNALIFRYEFSRAYMQQYIPEVFDIEVPPQLCTYADGVCTVPGVDGDMSFTIDAHGLMTARFADGSISWCVRIPEEPTAPPEEE